MQDFKTISVGALEPSEISLTEHNLLLYVKNGSVTVLSEGSVYNLSSGKGLIIPPMREFCLKVNSPSLRGFQILFDSFPEIPIIFTLSTGPKSPLRLISRNFFEHADSNINIHADGVVECALTDIRNSLDNVHLSDSSMYKNPALMAKAFMDKNFSCDIIAGDVADFCAVSESFLNKCFTSRFGITPKQYILKKRVTCAKKLLETTNLSSREISSAVGFISPQRFNDVFKKNTALTPLEYRATFRII